MKTNSKAKRLIAVLMSMVLVLSLVPLTTVIAAGDVAINAENFPDEIFRQYVADNFDKDSNGVLSETEIAAVTKIDVANNRNIKDLKGVEYFTALTFLDCSWNKLTSLDISKNTALTTLRCRANELTSLDISNCTELVYFECGDNNLTSLDVSKNTKLQNLSCFGNQLTSLDVSKNLALRDLRCSDNQITSLDLSANPELYLLYCYKNKLTTLNVSQNAKLEHLQCYDNQLTELDVTNNTKLGLLICYGNEIAVLDVSKNTALEKLSCYGNQLTELDVSKNTSLEELACSSNKLTELDISKNTALKELSCSSNQIEQLDISNNKELEELSCSNNQISELDVTAQTKLKELSCHSNKIAELDVSKNTALTKLVCSYNQLTELDVSQNTALVELSCSNNQLTELDVSKNTLLKTLYCISNQITELDLSSNTDLTRVECWNNKITDLDVSKSDKLTYLDCSSNRLASLDVSNNTALTTLDCASNQLAELDVSKNTALKTLECGSNQLTELDVTKLAKLTSLGVEKNQLTEIDVSKNTALTYLNCQGNKLESLDVSKNTALKTLYCYNFTNWSTPRNTIKVLDLSNNTELADLICSNLELTSLDFSKNTKLTRISASGNTYEITPTNDGTFDLTELPGNFDVNKASEWKNGTVDGNILTLKEGTNRAEYQYDLGNGKKETFTLVYKLHVHKYGDWENDMENHWKECACGSIGEFDEHDFEIVNAKDAQEFEPGYTGDKICTVCEYEEKGDEIPATHVHKYGDWQKDETQHWKECACKDVVELDEHDFEIVNAKEAQEFETGYTGDKICKVCKYEIKGEEIPATHVHKYGDWQKDETQHWKECACKDVSELGDHEFEIVNAKDATEFETGYTGDKICKVCKYEIKGEEIPATHVHKYGDWLHSETQHWKECACGSTSELGDHEFEIVNAKEAQEFEPGYTGDKICKVCKYEIKGEEIPATHVHNYGDWQKDETQHWKECACKDVSELGDHEFEIVNAKEATEFEAGYTGDKICKVCKYEIKGEEIPATHVHSYGDWLYNKTQHWKECACKDVSELGDHELELVNAKEATLITEGYTGDKVCKVCGYTEEGEVIPAAGIDVDIKDIIDDINPDDIKDILDDIKDVIGGIIENLPKPDDTPTTDPSEDSTDYVTEPSTQPESDDSGSDNEEVPETGATLGITAFAALSVAAAAAFVSKKKKD